MQDACGLFGLVVSTKGRCIIHPGTTVVRGLEQLQHRGTESSGLVGSNDDSDHFHITKGMGLVREVFSEANVAQFTDSRIVMGHNRYSTAGHKDAINCVQPFVVFTSAGTIAIAHNGELANKEGLRREVLRAGVGLSTDTDSEVIAQLLASHLAPSSAHRARIDLPAVSSHINGSNGSNGSNGNANGHDNGNGKAIPSVHELGAVMLELMESGKLSLSYSLLLMSQDRLYAVRDPYGNRPLCIGAIRDPYGELLSYVVSSETCALAAVGAEFVREVGRGEIVELSPDSDLLSSTTAPVTARTPSALCIFEYVYFARPSSIIQGAEVNSVRMRCGQQLGVESLVEADLVSNVPDSSSAAAIGFAKQVNLPYVHCLNKNAYVARTFIQPNDKLRQSGVHRKFTVIQEVIRGKRVILVDDSIVRGNTMRPIVKLLRSNGAREVHIRVASPPIRSPCFYGINIPGRSELIAARLSVDEICREFGADSVAYLSLQGLKDAVSPSSPPSSPSPPLCCTGCLDQNYPLTTPDIEDVLRAPLLPP